MSLPSNPTTAQLRAEVQRLQNELNRLHAERTEADQRDRDLNAKMGISDGKAGDRVIDDGCLQRFGVKG